MRPQADGWRLVAWREWRLLRRGRATWVAGLLLLGLAWLPPLLLPLRQGSLGLASMAETLPLTLAVVGVVLPLLALLLGAELLAGEIEDGSLLAVVTLPLSRTACVLGKCLGRAAILSALYFAAFASVATVIATRHGFDGGLGFAAVVLAGWLLGLACGGLGVAVGSGGGGRIRAFAAALVAWLVVVFVIDGVLLAALVALSPPPPTEVGAHGHDELTPAIHAGVTPRHHRTSSADTDTATVASPSRWLLLSGPVALYRVGALSLNNDDSFAGALPSPRAAALPLAIGWLLWTTLPVAVGVWRFGRTPLR